MSSCLGEAETQARAVLGLAANAPLAAWRPAFSLAIHSVHPDRGGDPDEARRVIEAYRLLMRLETERHQNPSVCSHSCPEPDQPVPFQITIQEAFAGVRRNALLTQGQSFQVRLPPGMRAGDLVTFDGHSGKSWVIQVTSEPGMTLQGSDLWLDVTVSPSFLRTGGPLSVSTPSGDRRVWVTRKAVLEKLVVIEGAGLPSRAPHRVGRAYIRLHAQSAQHLHRTRQTSEERAQPASRLAR